MSLNSSLNAARMPISEGAVDSELGCTMAITPRRGRSLWGMSSRSLAHRNDST